MSLAAPVDEQLLTSRQVCDAAGITYRQLDYWCRAGVITPAGATDPWGTPALVDAEAPGSGRQRRFTARQVAILRACGQLARLCADTPALAALVDAAAASELPVTVAIDAGGAPHVGVVVDETMSRVLGGCWVVTVEP